MQKRNMKHLFFLLLTVGLLIALVSSSQGQVLDKRFELNAFGGIAFFMKDLAKAEIDAFEDLPQFLQFTVATDLADQAMVGASIGYHLNQRFQVEGSFGWVPTILHIKTGVKAMGASSGSTLSRGEDLNLFIYHGNLNINFFTDKSRLVPFVTFGVGAMTYNFSAGSETDITGQFGGGLRILLNDIVGIRFQVSDYLSPPSFDRAINVATEVTDEQGQRQVFEQQIVKKAELQHDLVFRVGVCIFP